MKWTMDKKNNKINFGEARCEMETEGHALN